MLTSPLQGGAFPDLRETCARSLADIAADVHPIGGVVPVMEQQRYADLAAVIIASKKGLPPGKPVHLFGAGHPLVFPMAVLLGCDLFDSASYIKYAKDDRLLFSVAAIRVFEVDAAMEKPGGSFSMESPWLIHDVVFDPTFLKMPSVFLMFSSA